MIDILSNSDFAFDFFIYFFISSELGEILIISLIILCSGAKTAKVIPNSVSGRVVNTGKFKSVSKILRLNSAPLDLPIQFSCMDLTLDGQSPISSNPLRSSSEYSEILKNH